MAQGEHGGEDRDGPGPFRSLALVLDGDRADFNVPNIDAARLVKALVDRAEIIFGIPGQSVLACAKDDVERAQG